MKSWRNSSNKGVEYTIRPETLETFFSDAQSVEQRLTKIAGDSGQTEACRQQATELLEHIMQGR